VVVDNSSGNIYVSGWTYGGLDGNTNAGSNDIFLVKYNSNGEKQWGGAKQLGTTNEDYAYGVALDSSGNIYVTGWTYGGLDGNSNSGGCDLFLIKYNPGGIKQWTKQLGTASDDCACGVAVDNLNNIYVAGDTNDDLDGNINAGGWDIFLVKYNSDGEKQWTKQLGTASDDHANGVALDSSGNIYVTGYTYGGLDGNSNSGLNDIFLVKYNSSGVKQ
jgi:hypothetical protein